MPYFEETTTNHQHHLPRNPKETNAYLVGGGIASLAAAALLIRDAQVPGHNIYILESSKITGGSMDAIGRPDTSYIMRGGRMLNFTYVCLYDLLSSIPSLKDNNETVMDEIKAFNAIEGNKTHAKGRLVTRQAEYPGMKPGLADASDFEMSVADREALMKLIAVREAMLEGMRIQDLFSEDFFMTNFWFMFASMFAFQKWHSAVEFRRYLHRFIQEIPRIDTLEGVDRTPFNQYDSIILPLTRYLEAQGVEFKYGTVGFNNIASAPQISYPSILTNHIQITTAAAKTNGFLIN